MYHPHDGRFCEGTEENIERAKNGTLELDIPDLDFSSRLFSTSAEDHSYAQGDQHPITFSTSNFCAFDRFHETNSTLEVDILRRLDNVKQTRGQLNSQAVEELFSHFKNSRYFLTQMSPLHHIFLMRLLLHLRNKARNASRLQRIKETITASFQDSTLSYGRDRRIEVSGMQNISLTLLCNIFVN